MKISIAVATYNGGEFLLEQLNSFAKQTVLPHEVIVNDDCSSDDTRSIVRTFSESVPFSVKLFSNERNKGYCQNFSEALSKTTGDIIFLSDQDDVWFSNKIEYMLSVICDNPDNLVYMNDATLTDGSLNSTGLTKLGQIKSAGLRNEHFVMGCCCAVRRQLLELALPIPTLVKGHDNWIVRFAELMNVKYVDDTPLQYYRRHETNESQFVANKTKKVNWLDSLTSSRNKTDSEYSNYIKELEEVTFRLKSSNLTTIFTSKVGLDELVIRNENDINKLKNRIKIRSCSMPLRFLAVLLFFSKGGYGFNFKSAARDLFG